MTTINVAGSLAQPQISNSNKQGGTLTVGEEEMLAAFRLRNDEDKEDVTFENVTLTISGSADDDLFADLVLYADGQEVASDLEVEDGELVITNLDYDMDKDDSTYIDFELRGMVTELNNSNSFQFIIEDIDDMYIVGKKYMFPVTVEDLTANYLVSDAWTVEGAEITVSFDKSDIDEAKSGSEDVFLGLIELKAEDTNYTLEKYYINVDGITT